MATFRQQVYRVLFAAIAVLMLNFSAFALDVYKDVAPDKKVGSGTHALRVLILDPVTQLAWVNKPYRIIIYEADEKVSVDLYGTTDSKGNTATIMTPQVADNYIARPLVPAGKFAYTAKMRLLERDGSAISKAQYIHFFSDGSIFTGISDARGETAEVGSNSLLDVKTKVNRFDNKQICDWQATASLLNQTIDSKPAQKIELIKQVINFKKTKTSTNKDCNSLYEMYSENLVTQLLGAAFTGGADLLNSTAPYVVDKQAELLRQDDLEAHKDEKDKQKSAEEWRAKAIFSMLVEASNQTTVPSDFYNKWTDEAMRDLAKTKSFDDGGDLLNLAELFIQRKEYGLVEKLANASARFSERHDDSETARQKALLALVLKSKGDVVGAQAMFESANNWVLLNPDKDVQGQYRSEFKSIPAGQFRVTAAMIQDAQQWCPVNAKEKKNLMFSMFPDADKYDDNSLSRILTLDALLSSGKVKPGKVRLINTCKNATRMPATFELSKQDIAQIHQAVVLGNIFVAAPLGKQNANPQYMQMTLLAWLQSVKLAPGLYKPDNLTKEINFGF